LLTAKGLFSEKDAMQGHEDFDLWLKVLPHARFAVIPAALTAYRIHPQQITSPFERKAYKKQAMQILKSHTLTYPFSIKWQARSG